MGRRAQGRHAQRWQGQGNNIAVFPTDVQGICAQLDLWRTSPNYKNKRFADAIAIWSGHNEVPYARTSLIDGIKLAYRAYLTESG